LVVTGTGPGLCRILDADFHEKASLVKADVAAPSCSNPTASALHHRPVLALILSSALRTVFWMGAVLYLGALFSKRHGFGTGEVGLVYLASGIGYLAGSAAAGSSLASRPVSRVRARNR
jgi:predicted MFS family arabinose efflux permease